MSELGVLAEGPGFLAVQKPAGLTVIPGRGPDAGESLQEKLEDSLRSKLWVVHRLDRDTSGVVIFARTPELHRALSRAFELGEVRKRYLALARGAVEGTLELTWALTEARRGAMRLARAGEDGKLAHTRIRPLERLGAFTWVEAIPFTGRTHQIRVHLIEAGHPLAVDPQYGQPGQLTAKELGGEGDQVVLTRTPLHAASLEFPTLGSSGLSKIEAPLPADLEASLRILRDAKA